MTSGGAIRKLFHSFISSLVQLQVNTTYSEHKMYFLKHKLKLN